MTVQCPVSPRRVGEITTRFGAGLVLILAIGIGITQAFWLSLPLLADFLIRAFYEGNGSPVKFLARSAVKTFQISDRPIDAAPKEFAAKLGAMMSFGLVLTAAVHAHLALQIIASILAICAGLEAFLGICLGCHIYTLLGILKKPTEANA